MNIVKPKIEIISKIDTDYILNTIEGAGRICYQSEPKGDPEEFIKRRIQQDHTSILEHAYLTFDITCDRGVSHELVRHRIASYSQESTRYVNYGKADIDFIEPIELERGTRAYEIWADACEKSEEAYKMMIFDGEVTPQVARSVLNNSVRTKVRVTMNMRSLRNFFSQRCDKAAHPHMKELAIPFLLWAKKKIPVIFDDISYDMDFWTGNGFDDLTIAEYIKEA